MKNKKNSIHPTMESNRVEEKKSLVLSFLHTVSQYRLAVRGTLLSKPFNVITFLSLIPFFLGFYDFLNQNQHVKKTLFEKTVPGYNIPTELLYWETFRHFKQPKKDFLRSIEKIHWSPNSFILTKTSNLNELDQELFIGSFPTAGEVASKGLSKETTETKGFSPLTNGEKSKRVTIKKVFGNSRLYLNSVDNQSFFLERFTFSKPFIFSQENKTFDKVLDFFYLDLDEIPVKIDSLISYTHQEKSDLKKNVFESSESFNFSSSNEEVKNVPFFKKTLSSNQEFPQEQSIQLSMETSLGKKNLFKPDLLKFQEKLWNQYKNDHLIFHQKKPMISQKFVVTPLKNEAVLKKQLKGVESLNFPRQSKSQVLPRDKSLVSKTRNSTLVPTTRGKGNFLTPQVNSDLFFQKQLSWFLTRAQNTCKLYSLDLFPTNDRNNLQVIISDVEQLFIEQGFSFLRRMSGYLYPDMNVKQVNTFLLQHLFSEFPRNFISYKSFPKREVFWNQLGFLEQSSFFNKSKANIKILFSANPSFIQNFSLDTKKVPNFAIQTGSSTLKDLDQNETLYDEQAIFLNKKTGLDWKTKNQNLKFWLKNYFSPVNPLTESKQTILGNRVKTKIDFLVIKNQPVVPFLTPTEWEKIYTQNKNRVPLTISQKFQNNQIFSKEFEINGIDIPSIEIFIKKSQYAFLHFDLNPTLDYLYSFQKASLFGRNSISAKTPPGNILEQAPDTTIRKSISYKKVLSILTDSDKGIFLQKVNFDNWEPLTFRSWLIVSQISFAFVFVSFLKSLFTEYFNELIWFIIEVGFSLGIIDQNLQEELELLTGRRDKGFRILTKPRKQFRSIAGINTLLPEITEIVWFLRTKRKDYFSLSKNFPQGLLLCGPPGTGKTVLVQAIAGEAQVPVVALSGSSLFGPGESGALKLELLFQEAREMAPCIVFIDEIETLAQKRQGVLQNPMGGDEIFSIFDPTSTSADVIHPTGGDFFKNSETSLFKTRENIESLTRKSTQGETKEYIPSKHEQLEKYQEEQLTLLTELLIELDGVRGRQGVIVIGATNRPELLDSAILRPGRFDKILELGLPSHEKRVEILTFYGKFLGYDPTISWEYFANRTIGFSAADLASIMNQSSIRAILNIPKNSPEKAKHTLQTIEHGIDRITTSELETINKKGRKLFVERVAYYQAGKMLLSKLLEYHPPIRINYLWPRRQNRRSLQILTNLQKYFFQFARRVEIEQRIIGAFGGKAAEILFLQKHPGKISTFGLADLNFAFVLTCFLIEKWYLYSKSTIVAALTQLVSNKNSSELSPEKIEFFKEVAFSMELPPHLFSANENDQEHQPFAENFHVFSGAWWQLQISLEFEFVQRHFADWYRLYLPNPEEKELNIDWSPPDEFYHRNQVKKNLNTNTSIFWNDVHRVVRDYQVHSFVLQSFNKALCLLDDNRESLDKLVFELIKREVLRESEIEQITSLFNHVPTTTDSKSTEENIPAIKILTNSFGQDSRRKVKNWIDFTDFLPTK